MKYRILLHVKYKMRCCLFILLIGLSFFSHAQAQAQKPREVADRPIELPQSNLLYVSDYLSFIGEDDQGHVAFALGANRGRDGEAFQAEHFVVLHDEQQGWLPVEGNGQYHNETHELLSIPNSEAFQFQGNPREGWTIISVPNGLTLKIQPIPTRIAKSENDGHFWMGSAPATLLWKERTLKGRIIYEFLLMPEFNRLTRTYWALWSEFQGFYLSAPKLGDLYLHRQHSELLAPLLGELNGFLTAHEESDPFQVLQLTTVEFKQGFGFYQLPQEWVAHWSSVKGSGTARLVMSESYRIANWLVGGISMGIIRGEITHNGQTYQVYGLVELII